MNENVDDSLTFCLLRTEYIVLLLKAKHKFVWVNGSKLYYLIHSVYSNKLLLIKRELISRYKDTFEAIDKIELDKLCLYKEIPDVWVIHF